MRRLLVLAFFAVLVGCGVNESPTKYVKAGDDDTPFLQSMAPADVFDLYIARGATTQELVTLGAKISSLRPRLGDDDQPNVAGETPGDDDEPAIRTAPCQYQGPPEPPMQIGPCWAGHCVWKHRSVCGMTFYEVRSETGSDWYGPQGCPDCRPF